MKAELQTKVSRSESFEAVIKMLTDAESIITNDLSALYEEQKILDDKKKKLKFELWYIEAKQKVTQCSEVDDESELVFPESKELINNMTKQNSAAVDHNVIFQNESSDDCSTSNSGSNTGNKGVTDNLRSTDNLGSTDNLVSKDNLGSTYSLCSTSSSSSSSSSTYFSFSSCDEGSTSDDGSTSIEGNTGIKSRAGNDDSIYKGNSKGNLCSAGNSVSTDNKDSTGNIDSSISTLYDENDNVVIEEAVYKIKQTESSINFIDRKTITHDELMVKFDVSELNRKKTEILNAIDTLMEKMETNKKNIKFLNKELNYVRGELNPLF